MAGRLTPLGSLGEKVAAALEDDGGERQRAIDSARREFSARLLQPLAPPRHFGVRFAAALALAACVGVLGWFSFFEQAGPLRFQVNGTAGVAQTWLAAPSSQPLVVAFSDGTVLNVGAASRARVVDTDENGANIALESGSIHARVVHTSHSAWRLIAGPFAIRVTGTRFDVNWDPGAQQFSLAVLEGSVAVSGSIVGSERPVRAGEKLVASVVQGQLQLRNAELEAAAQSDAVEKARTAARAQGNDGDLAKTEPAAPTTALPGGASKDASAWRELAKSGDLRKAFAAADASGFQNACASATPAELLLLGDAARLSGRADRATDALLALRSRYPRDPRRAAAAFALGKVAFDQRHSYAEAAQWFATCVHEQPGGSLAREASGRRVEALQRSGNASAAEQAARDYLARYPDGPHADIARSLVK